MPSLTWCMHVTIASFVPRDIYAFLHPLPLPSCTLHRNKEKIDKITSSLKLKVSVRDSKMGDPRAHVFAICSQWLPLARAVLEMVTRKLPSPLEINEARAERLMCESTKTFDSFPPSTQELKRGEIKGQSVWHVSVCTSVIQCPLSACLLLLDTHADVYSHTVFVHTEAGLK